MARTIPPAEQCEGIRARSADGSIQVALIWADPGQSIEQAITEALGSRVLLGFLNPDRKALLHRYMSETGVPA